jgi:hypothetical protein
VRPERLGKLKKYNLPHRESNLRPSGLKHREDIKSFFLISRYCLLLEDYQLTKKLQ